MIICMISFGLIMATGSSTLSCFRPFHTGRHFRLASNGEGKVKAGKISMHDYRAVNSWGQIRHDPRVLIVSDPWRTYLFSQKGIG